MEVVFNQSAPELELGQVRCNRDNRMIMVTKISLDSVRKDNFNNAELVGDAYVCGYVVLNGKNKGITYSEHEGTIKALYSTVLKATLNVSKIY